MGIDIESKAIVGYVIRGDQFNETLQMKLKQVLTIKSAWQQAEWLQNFFDDLKTEEGTEEGTEEETESDNENKTGPTDTLEIHIMIDPDLGSVRKLKDLKVCFSNVKSVNVETGGTGECNGWTQSEVSLVDQLKQLQQVKFQLRRWTKKMSYRPVLISHLHIW